MQSDKHELRRCLYTEKWFNRRHSNRDCAHVDEFCMQLYFDDKGLGINGEIKKYESNT